MIKIKRSVGHNMSHLIDTFTDSHCCFSSFPYQVINLYICIKNQLAFIIHNNLILAKKIPSTNCGLQTFNDISHVNTIYKLAHEHTTIVWARKIKSCCGGGVGTDLELEKERERGCKW
jgi:hypothetical protein